MPAPAVQPSGGVATLLGGGYHAYDTLYLSNYATINILDELKRIRELTRAIIAPPVPAFYNHPQNLDDMINHIAMRIIDQFDIHLDVMNRWDGVLSNERQNRTEEE